MYPEHSFLFVLRMYPTNIRPFSLRDLNTGTVLDVVGNMFDIQAITRMSVIQEYFLDIVISIFKQILQKYIIYITHD